MLTLSYRDAVAKALQDSMREEPRLIIIGQNLAGHALKQLAETYGENRVRDCSISESAMVGMAVGAAMKGWKAVVMIAYADIASVCHMAIVQSAAKLHYLTNGRLNCPVIIRLPIARFRGHGPEGNEVGASWFYNVPDLNITMPGSANEAYWSFREALERPTPTLFFEDRSIHTRSGEITENSPGGKAQITRSGDRLTIIAAGRAAAVAEDAADEMAKHGGRQAVEVVSLGFIKPLDKDTILKSASKTGRVLIIQDEPPCSGYAPYVRCLLDQLPAGKLTTAPRIIAGADQFLPYWDERPFLPSLEGVVAVAGEMMR
ncbi:MAG: transketolase C-terminal domain-containing protein [Deltaproteobacteria bacterium]|nr:transketolase C-terminal domain-containing protein [Deltaproteobacteria bacterium]MDZ4342961.1 transketolase C-terminal domain-containing protein [Candidatus Binatia bacterium]